MPISEVLQEVYSSAPTGIRIYNTLHIHGAGITELRLVRDYVPQVLGGVEHEPCQMSVNMPAKAADGPQALRFAIGLIDSRAQRIAHAAIESGQQVFVTYREYLTNDKTTPARTPLTMVVTGGEFDGPLLTVEAQYFDMLNLAYPRERYTVDKAPGVKYI